MRLSIAVPLYLGLLIGPHVALDGAEPPRVAVIQLRHETVTFLTNDTRREDFIYPGSPSKGEALLQTSPKEEMGGFVQVAREYGAQLVGIESPGMPKTGTGSGWVTQDAYEYFVGRMIAELKEQGPFDGVYLCLHGAMGVRGIARPEAELARRVREVVGRKAVIVGTFDPHGNEDDAFLQQADLVFAYKYYPHYDGHLQGERAARAMIRAIRGDYRPVHAVRTVPILSPTVYQWTGQHPWSTLVQRCLTWEAREPDVYVNFFFGFPWADVPDAGMCFQVIANGQPDLAHKVADDLAETAWRMRKEMFTATPIYPVGEAVSKLKQALAEGRKPAVLADHSDRSGNATWVLREIIRQDVGKAVIATLRDDHTLAALAKAGAKAGDAFDMDVGGYMDQSAGQPVRVRGVLAGIQTAKDGRLTGAQVRFGRGNLLMLSPQLVQVTEPGSIRDAGVDISQFDVFAIKSRVHFRRGFDDNGFARTILLVEPPGPYLGTVHLEALPYQHLRLKDYYPFSENALPVLAQNRPRPDIVLGILGGMGPEATADCYRKIIAATAAGRDQEHIPTLIYSQPTIPDRTTCIRTGDRSIVPWLVEGVTRLETAGASFVVIPCNTAHYYLADMQRAVRIPILNMIDLAADEVVSGHPSAKKVGLLATSGTIATGLYDKAIQARGRTILKPDAESQENEVMAAIGLIKSGTDRARATGLLDRSARRLVERGAQVILLGCTETPLAFDPARCPVPSVDATRVLARQAVATWKEMSAKKQPEE